MAWMFFEKLVEFFVSKRICKPVNPSDSDAFFNVNLQSAFSGHQSTRVSSLLGSILIMFARKLLTLGFQIYCIELHIWYSLTF